MRDRFKIHEHLDYYTIEELAQSVTINARKLNTEITPEYSILEPADVARIHALNPEIKLIFLLRNPIERSWSSVRYNSSLGFNKVNLDSLDEVIEEMKSKRLTRRCANPPPHISPAGRASQSGLRVR